MNARAVLRGAMRLLRGVVLALLFALVVLAAGLWAWSGTQASLDWAWERYARPHGLQAQGLSGSLREGLRARGLQARLGSTVIDLHDLSLAWDPVFLLDRRVRITGLRAARLEVQQRPVPPEASPLPQVIPGSLTLPLDMSIDHFAIGHLFWKGRAPLHARDIAARYHYDAAQDEHRLTLSHVAVASGRYHGEGRLGGRPPFALQGWLRGDVQAPSPSGARPLRLAAQATAEGTLAEMALRLALQPAIEAGLPPAPRTPAATMDARVTPWRAPFVVQAQVRLRHLDLADLWPQAPQTDLEGRIDITPQRAARWRLHADLRNALPGPWDRQRLPLTQLRGHGEWRDAAALVRQLRAEIGAGEERARVEGAGHWLPEGGWRLDMRVDGLQPQTLHSALAARPGRPTGTSRGVLDGRLVARSQAGVTTFDLALRARASDAAPGPGSEGLALTLESLAAQGRWHAGGLELQGRAHGEVRLASLQAHPVRFALAARGERGAGANAAWLGLVEDLRLAVSGPRATDPVWTLRLQAPVNLRRDDLAQWVISAGQAIVSAPARQGPGQAIVSWGPVQWGGGELRSSGRVSGLLLSWLARERPGMPAGDMVFDAQWDLHLARTLRLSARLARVRGDITLLAETAQGPPTRVAAGVREASLTLKSDGEAIGLALRWASERAGVVDGRLSTRLARGGRTGWHWPRDAALSGSVQGRLPRIAAWSILAPPGWRLRGSLAADIAIEGTRAAPRLSGPLRADDLALRSVVDGIALENGRLRAHLDNRRVVIDELAWQTADDRTGRAGTSRSGGTLRASGHAAWDPPEPGRAGGLYAQLDARLDRLRAVVRSDRQLTVSGTVSASMDASQLAVAGDLRVDRARILVPDRPVPRLGDDVRVRGLPAGTPSPWAPEASSATRALRLDVGVDLGQDFRVSGRGIDTGVRGDVRITGTSFTQPRLVGTVSAVDGRFSAYGQQLVLQRGVLRFSGPHDDPALDVLAVRPDVDRRVGVQVTGRAQAPVFRLWSQEPATEAEKLSWLVLGRGAASGDAETVMLEEAALSLLARRAGLGTGGIAAAFGLDEFTLRREGEQGAAITLGKRLARNLYAAYERSLSGALGTLYVFYDLSARLTLRAEAGDRTGVDLIYALSFDRLGSLAPLADTRGAPHAPPR